MEKGVALDRAECYDLLDPVFGWRGRYRVLSYSEGTRLALVLNLGTGSKQHISVDRLRVSRCEQFAVKWRSKK